MSKQRFLYLTIVFILLIFTYIHYSKQNISNISTTSPTYGVGSVTTSSSANASCKAIHINPADPQAFLPDPKCTPGSLNDSVTQENLSSTICESGFTTTIRPPASYTNKLKREQIISYGYTDTNTKDYEEDHFISLELGGSPTDPRNLWPEPHASINEKDKVEDYLHKQVCDGNLSLADAQKAISNNWYSVFTSAHL